jgi:hypothetical protein
MKMLLCLAFLSLLFSNSIARAACTPIPGAADLWSNSSLRWVWVGEMHGTVETPGAFGDLVCDALAHGKHVTVALERFTNEQPALDAVLGAGNVQDAEATLLADAGWRQFFDGRSSQSMLALLVRLRDLKKQYPALRVAAIDGPSYTQEPGSRDEAIGQSVLALAGSQSNDLVLVLTGNVHAMKHPFSSYKTSAMFLPADQVFSLLVTDRGGEAWMMTNAGCGAQAHSNPDRDKTRTFGIYADPSYAKSGFDGVFALGRQVTASSPANTAALEASPCRKDFLAQPSSSAH